MTSRDLTPAEALQLELLVDASSVQAVLQSLSEICGLKAEHIEEAWHDHDLAKTWSTAEGAIGCFSVSREVIQL